MRRQLMRRQFMILFTGIVTLYGVGEISNGGQGNPVEIPVIRRLRTGGWSDVGTWEGGRVPAAGVKVQVRPGHVVTYDVEAPESLVIRSLHIAGTVTFASDKSTRLSVGLIKIEDSDSIDEEGFDCSAHIEEPDVDRPKAALFVGTPDRPIAANARALIRLTYIAGMKKESCPAIVCCAGRMDFHGDDNPTGNAVSHFRRVEALNWQDSSRDKAIVNLGGGPRPTPKTEKGVPIYLHGWFGAGRDALLVSTRSPEFKARPAAFHAEPPLTGNESRVAEVAPVDFPQPLDPVDDLPPATVVTRVRRHDGTWHVLGTCSDNGTVLRVVVNGREARALSPNFATWEIELDSKAQPSEAIVAHAEDAAGNIEKLPHRLAGGVP